MLLHWRPLKEHTPGTGILDYRNPCIKYLSERFPDMKNYSIHDLYCRQELMYDASGTRKTNEELYGSDPLLHHHLELAYRFIAEQDGIPILFGRVVLDWFIAEFDAQYVDGCYVFVVNGFERIAYHLDHPEYTLRWASNDRLRVTASVLENISSRHSIPTKLYLKSSPNKTKRDWVHGNDRMTQIAHQDREKNILRRHEGYYRWWIQATQETRDELTARQNATCSATWARISQAAKNTASSKMAAAWLRKTEEERAAIIAKRAAAWSNRSEEERAAIIAKRATTLLARTDEEKAASDAKRAATLLAKTDEERAATTAKRAANRLARTDEEKAASTAKRSASRLARTDEEKARTSTKIATTLLARTDEEKAASTAKRAATLLAKTDEEKAATTAKRAANRLASTKPGKTEEEWAAIHLKRKRTLEAKSDAEIQSSKDKRKAVFAARSPQAIAASNEKKEQTRAENLRRKKSGEKLLTRKEMKSISWKK